MAKKVEYIIEENDAIEMRRLAKVAVATHDDCESIYSLLKKYINPQAAMYRLDCNCYTSISNYWQMLMQFYSENNGKVK